METKPKTCASCGSTEGVEGHHLVPQVYGDQISLVVPLCGECHGKAHGVARPKNLGALIKEGIRKSQDQGVVFGWKKGKPRGPKPTSAEFLAKQKAACERGRDAQMKARHDLDLKLIEKARSELGVVPLCPDFLCDYAPEYVGSGQSVRRMSKRLMNSQYHEAKGTVKFWRKSINQKRPSIALIFGSLDDAQKALENLFGNVTVKPVL